MIESWLCRVCGTRNAPIAEGCVACRELRAMPAATPAGEQERVPVASVTSAPSASAGVAAPSLQGDSSPVPPSAGRRRQVPVTALLAVVIVGLIVIGALVLTRGSDSTEDATSGAPAPTTSQPTSAPSSDETSEATTAPAPTPSTNVPEADPTPDPVDLGASSLTARASSVLPPVESQGLTYGPENLLDGDMNTAWSQDGSEGGVDPIGSWVAFDLPQTTDVMRVSIINGYVKSDESYGENARARDIVISDGSGGSIRATLDDVRSSQEIAVEFAGATTITITIESVYPGSDYEDVALTEVRLAGLATG